MNFAYLNRVKAISGTPLELIQKFKLIVRQQKNQRQAEIAFYTSAEDAKEFYILSFWYTLEDLEVAKDLWHNLFFKQFATEVVLVEEQLFRLSWEYRMLHLTPAISHIRLTTFPEDYPQPNLNQLLSSGRQSLRQASANIGAWLGRSLDGKTRILSRADWSNLPAQLEYVGSQVLHDCKVRRKEGVTVEYASFDLQGIIQSE